MTLAVPSPTLVTSVTRVTPGQPSWLPTLPTPWARDDRGQLRCGVRRSGPDSFAAEHHVLVQQVREPGLFGQFHDRDQSGAGHQILVIEHGRAVTPGMPQVHRKCPSDPRRLGLQQTYCRRSKGTFVISTQSVATLVHGFRLRRSHVRSCHTCVARFRRSTHLLECPRWASLRIPEVCGRQSTILPQRSAPVSGVFPAGFKLRLLEIGLQAIQLSPCRADPLTHHPIRLGMTASFLACYCPPHYRLSAES